MRTHRVARTVAILLLVAALAVLILGVVSALTIARGGLGAGWGSGWQGWAVIPLIVSAVLGSLTLLLFGALLLFLTRINANLSSARKRQVEKVELPAAEAPKIEAPKADIVVPAIAGAAAVAVPAIEAGLPKVEVEAPKVELPKVDIEAPKVDIEPLKAAVELPEIELPKVDLEAPKIEAVLPEIELPEIELPKVDIEAPRRSRLCCLRSNCRRSTSKRRRSRCAGE